MAEPENLAMPPRAPRWMKIVLGLSLAINLAVVGLAIGAFLKDGPRRGMPRDLSLGPFTEAFGPEDRQALREAFRERVPGVRASREEARADLEAVIAALRVDPVDAAALGAALTALETRSLDRLALGKSLVEARLLQMSPEERRAFADRLERGIRGRPSN